MKINEQPPITSSPLGRATGPKGPARRPADASAVTGAGAPGRAGTPAAKVELSARSRELHEAMLAAQAAPDVRPQVVADVRARIDDGTYRIDPERIARGILDSTA